MIVAERLGGAHSLGWLTSVCLHAVLAFGALLVTQRLTLAPQPAPFTWNVALLSAPSTALQPSPPPTTLQAPIIKAPSPTPLAEASTRAKGSASSTAAMTGEPVLPASDEPIKGRNQTSAALDTPHVESIEQQQTVEQIVVPAQPVASDPQLPNREPEMRSEFSQTTQHVPRAVASGGPEQLPSLAPAPRPDYAWLSETIMRRMQELKRYPADARLDRAEGKVVLKAVIRSNGAVEAVEVFQSSGHQSLDRAAVELLTQAGPFQFPRPLEKPQMTVKIPMNYRLEP